MCRMLLMGVLGVVVLAVSVGTANAAFITNGALNVTISNTNGSIDAVTFGGSDYYNPGTPVSDYGFQVGTNASSFRVNTTTGGAGFSAVVTSTTSSSITVTGSYTAAGSNIGFTRVYSLVAGTNVLRTTTTVTNNGIASIDLRMFDTFDPDQGVAWGRGTGTTNDVFNLNTGAGTAKVGQAYDTGGLTVVMGSLAAGAVVASGSPFGIFSGTDLNNFFSSPYDGNGTFADSGTHVGYGFSLAAGASGTFRFDQAYGTSVTNAQDDFIIANRLEEVPAPPGVVLAMIGLMSAGGMGWLRRRKAVPAAA